MNADYYVNLVGKAGQYICPICGCANNQYIMDRDTYWKRLAAWSKLDSETQKQQADSVFCFAFEGHVAMNTRCYDSYFDYPVIDLQAAAQMAWKRRNKTKEWFSAKAKNAGDVFKKEKIAQGVESRGSVCRPVELESPRRRA